ncbi:Oxoglutarate iron-dependent oxygenase protein [Rutstroemia sp. NJR-2017a WRK4]|nr:Oxoglutarate iron-dependent oxygenase protein [Rutstroemia sp. NJR-2017a WRK4]
MAEVEYFPYYQGGIRSRRPILRGPKAHETFNSISLVDMTNVTSSSFEERMAIAKEVKRVGSDVGFFYAQSHPFGQGVIDEAFEVIEAECHIHKTQSFRRLEPLFVTKLEPEIRGDMKEAFLIGPDEMNSDQNLPFPPVTGKPSPNSWPKNNPRFRTSWPLTRITCTINGEELGLAARRDFACFTVLYQDQVEAPEVLNKNGTWVGVPLVPRSFIINIADFFMHLITNGHFASTIHRVVLNTEGKWIHLALEPETFVGNLGDIMARITNDELLSTVHRFVTPERPLVEGYEKVMTTYEHFKIRLQSVHHQHPSSTRLKS